MVSSAREANVLDMPEDSSNLSMHEIHRGLEPKKLTGLDQNSMERSSQIS